MLYIDIPTRLDISALAAHRSDMCVSIYLRTAPITQRVQADRIELKNLVQLAVVAEQFDDLIDDDGFWRFSGA
jgi:hypothetical protein